MAKRKRFSGTPAQHTESYRTRMSDAQNTSRLAASALRSGDCGMALRHLYMAHEQFGSAKTHLKESTNVASPSANEIKNRVRDGLQDLGSKITTACLRKGR